jgi:hypothetical protein
VTLKANLDPEKSRGCLIILGSHRFYFNDIARRETALEDEREKKRRVSVLAVEDICHCWRFNPRPVYSAESL